MGRGQLNRISLELLLQVTGGLETSEKHDKIYALLGLCEEEIAIDYDRDPAETFILVARVLLRTSGDLNFLSFETRSNKERIERLPTWVGDSSASQLGLAALTIGGRFSAAGNLSKQDAHAQVMDEGKFYPPNSLGLQGVLLDVIA